MDPAFRSPTKPIGPIYTKEVAKRLASDRGWKVAPDGLWWRRVVASPEPRAVVDLSAVQSLGADSIVICAGGGGVPVSSSSGEYEGVEAVIDKDLTSSLLAIETQADVLVILTDVEGIDANWGGSSTEWLRRTSPSELRKLEFAPGSMAPKVEAACRFVEIIGKKACVGLLTRAGEVLAGETGTAVVPD